LVFGRGRYREASRWFRCLPIWLVFLAPAGCASPPASGSDYAHAGDSLDLGTRVDRYLRQRVNKGYSGVVLIARDDSVLVHAAYSRDNSITTESVFWIGSVSKPLTAAAVLRLRDEGRLSLSDPLTRFFQQVPPDKQEITVRHLLTHTAGLGEYYAADGISDRDAAVRALLARPLERAPGTGYGYSNDAYNLLAAVIEVAAGLPFETYVRDRVLSPAGMNSTGFWGEARERASFAPVAIRLAQTPNWGHKGATGMSSTAGDLYQWHLALEGDAVLPDSTRRQAFTEQVQKPNGGAYGYGWQVARTRRETTLLAHGGAESRLRHFASLYRFIDEGIVVITLSNAREEVAQETFGGLLRVLFP
jgi:CubicO group peptidase (beta-lactamase class C family)